MKAEIIPENPKDQMEIQERLHTLLYKEPIKSKIPFKDVTRITLIILRNFFKQVTLAGYDLKNLPPAHDLGHMIRDSIRAFMLLHDEDVQKNMTSEDLISAIIAGVLHDIGMIVVPRYGESKKLIRHAEAGALFVEKYLNLDILFYYGKEIKEYISHMVTYSIAAHTNYMESQHVEGYEIKPYKKIWENGNPIQPVEFVKYCDFNDFNGFYAILRGVLACVEAREDFTSGNFQEIEFDEKHMHPYLGLDNPQYSSSVFGRAYKFSSTAHDAMFCNFNLGITKDYRNSLSKLGIEIMQSDDKPDMKVLTQTQLYEFLCEFSMCGEKGQKQIERLVEKFNTLPEKIKRRWYEILTTTRNSLKVFESQFEDDDAKTIVNNFLIKK